MSQRDYILRIAEELGSTLAQVLYNKQIKDYATAHKLIDGQCKQVFGMGIGFMRSVPEETLLSMLTSFDSLDTQKCWFLAILFNAEGDIYQDQENTGESYYSYIRALNLILEVLLLDTTISGNHVNPQLDDLLAKLSEYDLPTKTKLLLFQYFDHSHQYARAEDLLFEMLEVDEPDEVLVSYGFSFYQQLKRKSEAELRAGNFSREEVDEGFAQLERFRS